MEAEWPRRQARFTTAQPERVRKICELERLNSRIAGMFWRWRLRGMLLAMDACRGQRDGTTRDLMLPSTLTKRLINHARPNDVTEGYAAD